MVSVQWESLEMPSIPILVNKKTLKKHAQLFVHQKDKQICENNKETEKNYNAFWNDLLDSGKAMRHWMCSLGLSRHGASNVQL